MRKLKKIFLLFTIFICTSIYANDKILDKGMELSDSLFVISSSRDLFSTLVGNPESEVMKMYDSYFENLKKSDLKSCYKIDFSLDEYLEFFLQQIDYKESAKKYFSDFRINQLYFSFLNRDSTILVINSLLNDNLIFDCKDLTESTIYVYIFENSLPVIVSFIKQEDDAVFATASFIYDKSLVNCSEKTLKSFFNNDFVDSSVQKIK